MRLFFNLTKCAAVAAAAFCLLGTAGKAKAAFFSGTLYNTGVDASGTPLPDSTVGDPHYTLVTVPPPDSANPNSTTTILVRTSAGGFPIGPWVGDDSVSAWIGPDNAHDLSGPVGTYDYRTTFTLPSAASLVTITGQWSTDNAGTDILLNGVSTGNTAGGFTSFYPFTITGSGLAGVNTLDFLVYNAPPASDNPTGLRVEFTSATAVPEPASLTLLGVGVVGLMGYGWRRRMTPAATKV